MKKQSGFTLIELAIVLVIIGLLLGGVLKGQELLEMRDLKLAEMIRNLELEIQNADTTIKAGGRTNLDGSEDKNSADAKA